MISIPDEYAILFLRLHAIFAFVGQNKLDIVKAMMDCLLAKAIPCITDCVVAELEKLGPKYRVALRLSKDPRFQRLPCSHRGTYADDCLVEVGVNPTLMLSRVQVTSC